MERYWEVCTPRSVSFLASIPVEKIGTDEHF